MAIPPFGGEVGQPAGRPESGEHVVPAPELGQPASRHAALGIGRAAAAPPRPGCPGWTGQRSDRCYRRDRAPLVTRLAKPPERGGPYRRPTGLRITRKGPLRTRRNAASFTRSGGPQVRTFGSDALHTGGS